MTTTTTPGSPQRRRRGLRFFLRCVEFSPVVAAVLLATVWFGVPAELKPVVDQARAYQEEFARDRASGGGGLTIGTPYGEDITEDSVLADPLRTAKAWYQDQAEARRMRVSPGAAFGNEVHASVELLGDRTRDLYDSSGRAKELVLKPDDRALSPIARFDRSWDATSYVFLLPNPPKPPLVASAIPRPDLLDLGRTVSSSDATATFEALWRRNSGGVAHPQFLTGVGGGSAGSGYAEQSEVRKIGDAYFVYWVLAPEADTEDPGRLAQIPPGTPQSDPSNPNFQQALEEMARRYGINLLVAGPLDLEVVPQIVPEGVSVDEARAFGESVLLGEAVQGGGYTAGEVVRMTPRQKAASGAKYLIHGQVADPDYSGDRPSQPQTMLYVSTWDHDPTPALRRGPLRVAWEWLAVPMAADYIDLLVAGFVFLGVTLIASPAAFVYERRLTERERVAAEMERVQRDAHDRVYNRMAALSMRLQAEAASTSDDASAAALTAAAGDLSDTNRDLREILGDARASSAEDAAKSVDPSTLVADQLAALTVAQRSMTGVDVDFRADDDLPPLAPEAGWDLQCIAEEAISNAVRHGHATRVDVSLLADAEGVRLEVADDGSAAQPIDLESLPASSTGLRGIRARAERLGGTLEVDSGDGGTTVTVRIPARLNGRANGRANGRRL